MVKHSQCIGNGSKTAFWLVSSCVDTQAKTASASSLVAEYWRVENVVDRPVAASTFVLKVIIAAEDRRYSTDEKQNSMQ